MVAVQSEARTEGLGGNYIEPERLGSMWRDGGILLGAIVGLGRSLTCVTQASGLRL